MYSLSRRQMIFLKLLLNEDEYKPIVYYAKILEVSDKTLKSDLKDIREFLMGNYGLSVRGKTGQGIFLDADDEIRYEILVFIGEGKEQRPKGSIMGRRMAILKSMLLYSNMSTSVQKLSVEYFVSKASIVNDLKFIESWVERFNLSFEKSFNGTRLIGSEVNMRKAIACLIDEYQKLEGQGEEDVGLNELTKLDKATLSSLLELFDIEEILFVESVLAKLEKANNIQIEEIYFVNLLTHILICIKRISEGIEIAGLSHNGQLIRTDTIGEYQQAMKIAEQIQDRYSLKLNDEEIYYIYQYLASSRLEKSIKQDESSDNSIEIATFFVNYISEVLELDFYKEEELFNGLLLHIRPMLNRLRYNIQISNPLLDEVITNYQQLFGVCRIIFDIISKKYSLQRISDDEIAHIAVYCQTLSMKVSNNKKVVVVCHSGYGTSQLLKTRLERTFSNIEVIDVISSRNIDKVYDYNIDLIISTVPLNSTKVPSIMISSILTENDIKAIRDKMMSRAHGIKDNAQPLKLNEIASLYDKSREEMSLMVGKYFNAPAEFTETELAPFFSVCTDLKFEKFSGDAIWINNMSSGKIEVYIASGHEAVFKKILSNAYYISVSEDISREIKLLEGSQKISDFTLRKWGDRS